MPFLNEMKPFHLEKQGDIQNRRRKQGCCSKFFYYDCVKILQALHHPCSSSLLPDMTGSDAATRLAYSSHSSWTGAGNQGGEHKPVLYEPHLATGFDRSDRTHAGEKSIPEMFFFIYDVASWIDRRHTSLWESSSCLVFSSSNPRQIKTQTLKRSCMNGRMREKNSGECNYLHFILFVHETNDPFLTQTFL